MKDNQLFLLLLLFCVLLSVHSQQYSEVILVYRNVSLTVRKPKALGGELNTVLLSPLALLEIRRL